MTTSSSSPAPTARHAKSHRPRWQFAAIAVLVLSLVAGIAGMVASSGHHSPRPDRLAEVIATIPRSPQVQLLVQDAGLMANCTKPTAALPKGGTVGMVWPGELTAGLIGSDAIESYSPTTSFHGWYTDYSWNLNPLQHIQTGTFSVRVAAGMCSAPLKLLKRRGAMWSLGSGKYKPQIRLVARVPRGDSLVWTEIVAVNKAA